MSLGFNEGLPKCVTNIFCTSAMEKEKFSFMGHCALFPENICKWLVVIITMKASVSGMWNPLLPSSCSCL